jgi:pyruvate formate lyase activating enzyme
LNDKIIYDITPFTHLDYPGKLAAIAWFCGCNMRCIYCYNSDIVFAKSGEYTEEDLIAFLKKRMGLLDGVVLSGGEPTLNDLAPLCRQIKAMGYTIKLDTNGLDPIRVKELVEEDLVDYIALDFKAGNGKFGYVTGSSRFDKFTDTLDYLIEKRFDFEVRTTVHADLLQPEDINMMIEELKSRGYERPYYLQKFIKTSNNIGDIDEPSQTFDISKLDDTLPIIWR